MLTAKRFFVTGCLAGCLAALALSPGAMAQTMGEYGMTVGHAASGAAKMPDVEPRSGVGNGDHGGSGNTSASDSHVKHHHSEEVRSTDDDLDAHGASVDRSGDDWTQVK